MKRITIKRERKSALDTKYYAECKEKDCVLISCAFDWPCEPAKAIFERAGEIEDILGREYDLDHLRELVEADREGRCVVLPKDGMVYYIEEAGGEKWIGNKPIQQVVLRCGFGMALLEFSLFDKGKYFSRAEAQAALRREQDGE